MEIKIDEKTALQFFYSFAFKNKKHEQFHVNFFLNIFLVFRNFLPLFLLFLNCNS
jgi:hypothetical protein